MARGFYKKYLITVAIVAGIVFLNNYFLNKLLQTNFYKIITGLGSSVNKNLPSLTQLGRSFFKAQDLIDENSALKQENNILRGELAQLENLKNENQFLRNQLGVSKRLDFKLEIVRIFDIQRSNLASVALIDKGVKDGVKKSMPLIAAGNVLVGRVDQVFEGSAKVILLDDPRLKISGTVQEGGTLVEVSGRLRNEINIGLVAAGDKIKEGDTIVTSGLDGLPESLLIAKVVKVETPSSSLFKNVSAQPIFDLSLGSSLFVILK